MHNINQAFFNQETFAKAWSEVCSEPDTNNVTDAKLELETAAKLFDGEIEIVNGRHQMVIDTGDKTSKTNYDDLLDIVDRMKPLLFDHIIVDYSAEHDRQTILFSEKLS